MFQSARSSKASEHIVEQIRKAIFEGRLRPGDRLPAETQLMQSFQVSKATLREALRALEFLGFLEIRKGANGGAFVTKVDVTKARDLFLNFLHFQDLCLEDLSEVRLILEPYVAEKSARLISPEDLHRLQELNEQCESTLAGLSSFDLRCNEIEFHRIIGRATGNPILSFILEFVENLLVDAKEVLRPDQEFSRRVLTAHQRIVEAICNKDAQRAREEMARHVKEVERDLSDLQRQRKANSPKSLERQFLVELVSEKGGGRTQKA
ncbi:MAG: FadR/GntR family transcriptional regulator [bacterium]